MNITNTVLGVGSGVKHPMRGVMNVMCYYVKQRDCWHLWHEN